MKKITKDALSKLLCEKTGHAPAATLAMLNALDDVIADELKSGGKVYIDNIGTFERIEKTATRKYIPSKGETVDVPARVVVKLKASKTLVERAQ